MADIELVVKMPEEIYKDIKSMPYHTILETYIINGTPLPKGHGRLIDADALPLNAIDDANYGSNYIRVAPTIIEADGEESMTREEAIKTIKELMIACTSDSKYYKVGDMAIKALEQEPSGDLISRQAVLNTLDRMDKALDTDRTVESYKELLTECYKDLPSVKQEPCEDAISRQAVLNQIFYSTDNSGDVVLGSALRHRIENLPPVEQEPKTGRWIAIDEEPHEDYECDRCGYVCSTFTANIKPNEEYKFCPNCGVKMESDEV